MRRRLATFLLLTSVLMVLLFGALPVSADTEVTFEATASDGYFTAENGVYLTAHNQADADHVSSAGNQLYVGQIPPGGDYKVYRTGLFFSTSSLPDTSVITGATLSFRIYDVFLVTNFDITVVDGDSLDDPLIVSDYGELLSQTTSFGTFSTVGLSSNDWVEITLGSEALEHISLLGTTKFALRSSRDISSTTPTNNEYIRIMASELGADDPRLIVSYTTTTGGGAVTVYPYGTYDGEIYATDAVYATAQQADTGTVVDTAITARVGQTTGFTVWRGYLYFDTSSIPSNATVTATIVSIYGHADNSDDDFNITIVAGNASERPLSSLDYDDLGSVSFGVLNTGSWGVGQYNSIGLNTLGRVNIICGGITQLGLRSSLDISATEPTQDEYMTFGTSRAPNKPILYVTYTLPDLGAPDQLEIVDVRVFDDFAIDIDSLLTVEYKCIYSPTPTVDPAQYYLVQLLENSVVVGQARLPNWGHAVVSIYDSSGLDPDIPRDVRIIGDPTMFASPPSATYTLQTADYAGDSPTSLDIWVRWKAISMADYYATSLVIYVEGTIRLNELGEAIFLGGIPALNTEHPELFQTASVPVEPDEDLTYEAYDPDVGLGTYLTTLLGTVGNAFGISGNMVGGLLLFVVVGAVFATTRGITGNVTGGAILSMPLIAVCGLLQIVPLAAIAVAGILCVALLMHGLWLSRT